MTQTSTKTLTTTMTEARVRKVMEKVDANFSALVAAGLVERDRASKWSTDLIYMQLENALEFFELQFEPPAGSKFGLRYSVSSDGSIQQDSRSGGIDLYGLAKGTAVNIYAHLRPATPQYVWDELAQRNWGRNGRKLDGGTSSARAFSSEGYAVRREHVGTWP